MPGSNRIAQILLLASAVTVACSHAAASETIRVAVADNVRAVTIVSKTGIIQDSAAIGQKLTISQSSAGKTPMRIASNGTFLRMNGRSYRGLIEVRKKRNGLLLAINALNIEDYLRGVVAAEIPPDWEIEALKAQAVAARTYALYRKKTSSGRPYHIVATVAGQVYSGRSGEHEAAARAVRETEGVVITYKGRIIPAFYHSSCGGRTESALELWGIDEPYLRGVDCECQEISKYGLWEKRVSTAGAEAALSKIGYRFTRIQDVGIEGITTAGRVREVVIRDASGSKHIPADRFRAALGYSAVPSIFFEIEMSGNEIVISGRGMGHGVGLCQWGAREMAQRGQDYPSILAHYYPGTQLQKLETSE